MSSKTPEYRRKMRKSPGALGRRVRRSWPWLFWGLAAVATALIYDRSEGFAGMVGVIESRAEPLAAFETARLLSLHVEVGDHVAAGDLVAELDTSLLDAEMAVTQARVAESRDSMTRGVQALIDMMYEADTEAHRAETELASERQRFARDRKLLSTLVAERTRRAGLVERGLADRMEVAMMDGQIAALYETVGAYPNVIGAQSNRLAAAKNRAVELRDWLSLKRDAAPMILAQRESSRTNDVLALSIQVIERRRERYVLRATRDGIVSRIFAVPGDVVPAGEVIVRLAGTEVEGAVGFLPEAHARDLTVGEAAVVSRSRATRGIAAQVASVGPEVLRLPGRASPIRGQSSRGRRVVIALLGEHDFVPGETVRIYPRAAGFGGLVRGLIGDGGDATE